MYCCTNMKMYVHLLVNTVPHVSSPLVRVFSCGALIGQETTLSHLVVQIMPETECQYIQLYYNDPFLFFVFMYRKGKFVPVRVVEQYGGAEEYVSVWPHALATLPLRNEFLEPLEYEAERATEPIWTYVLHYSLSVSGIATMEAIRKISKVRRLVLVTEMSKASLKSITALCNPSKEHGLGNPFFPVRAIPVDTMPNENGYVLMILMERIGLRSLPKSPGCLQSGSMLLCAEGGPDIHSVGSLLMPLAIEAKGKGGQMTGNFQHGRREFPGWKTEFKQSQREETRSLGPFGGHGLEVTASYRQYMLEGELPYSGPQKLRIEEKYRHRMAQEWGRQMVEEHLGWTEDDKQRRWPKKEQQRRLVDTGEHRKWIQEKEPRRYMGERELNRDMNEREFQREMKDVELQKWVERERERELVGMNPNMRGRNALVQEVIADSLKEAELSHLSAEASEKLKHLVAEAVRTVEVMARGERHGISTGSGVNRITPEGTADVRFGRSDTALPQSRHFEDEYSQHIREVDNPYDRRYDTYGGGVERSESKKMPQLRHFDEGYPPSLMEVDTQYQRECSVYDGGLSREGYQHHLESQQSIYSAREGPMPRTGVDRTGSQPMRLSSLFGGSSTDSSHPEGGNNVRRVYFSGSGNREQKFSDLPDTYTRHVNFVAQRTRNEDQPSHMGQSLHTAVEQNADGYVPLNTQNWDSSGVDTYYIPFSNPMKQLAGSMPKPPGTEDAHRPDGSSYIYPESVPRFNRFGAMLHHS